MANDLLNELLSMAVQPKSGRAVQTFDQRFKAAIDKQRQKVSQIGSDGFQATKSNWFQETPEGTFHVRLGRPKIGVTKPDGTEQFLFEAKDAAGINRIFDLAIALVDQDEAFASKVRAVYGNDAEKTAEEDPKKARRRTAKRTRNM